MNDATPKRLRPRTAAVRAGLTRSQHKETSEALFLTSGYVYDSAEEADARFAGTSPGYLYGRYANPTVRMFEERLAALEGAEDCLAVASGMAAVTAAVVAPLSTGDRVIAARAMFASCLWLFDTWLPKLGVEVAFVDGEDLGAWRDAVAAGKPPKVALIETPANPTLGAVDIAAVKAILAPAGTLLVADNAFASPMLQNPLSHGADVVTYSTTKHIDGQGRTLGGAILGGQKLLVDLYREFLRHTGPSLSPFNAWAMLKGLETLPLRVDAMSASAHAIAERLSAAPNVAKVLYPGLPTHPHRAVHARQMRAGGTLVAFEVKGGREGAWRFLDALEIIDISNNLGDAKSLATHPETTTHRRISDEARARIGVTPGLIRLSVGLEDPEDLIEDLLQALERAA